MTVELHPLERQTFNTQQLVKEHPPRFEHPCKQLVYDIACPPGSVHQGELVFSRWPACTLPEYFDCRQLCSIEIREDYFGYEPSAHRTVDWYLNFAHSDVFAFYGSRLMAQDEIQVAEHPALASLREALVTLKLETATVENNQPTPILVQNVERRCKIAIDPNPEQYRPQGLYGNRFSQASEEAIRLATHVLHPPTITNILAIEAPSHGYGRYTLQDLRFILQTAYSGFTAVKTASFWKNNPDEIVIHTGFWGCGAYGGNRTVMTILQWLVAHVSGIHRLVYHIGDASGQSACRAAQQLWDGVGQIYRGSVPLQNVLELVYAQKFEWGESDGN